MLRKHLNDVTQSNRLMVESLESRTMLANWGFVPAFAVRFEEFSRFAPAELERVFVRTVAPRVVAPLIPITVTEASTARPAQQSAQLPAPVRSTAALATLRSAAADNQFQVPEVTFVTATATVQARATVSGGSVSTKSVQRSLPVHMAVVQSEPTVFSVAPLRERETRPDTDPLLSNTTPHEASAKRETAPADEETRARLARDSAPAEVTESIKELSPLAVASAEARRVAPGLFETNTKAWIFVTLAAAANAAVHFYLRRKGKQKAVPVEVSERSH